MLIKKKETDIFLGLINDEFVYWVLKNYGFDNSWAVLPFMSANRKAIAINRRSETARKAIILYKNELYILKEIPWYCSEESFINYQISFQERLRSFGFPIPEIMETVNGTYYTKIKDETGEKFFFLQKYLNSSSWDGSLEYIRSAGKTLAELHNISNKIIFEMVSDFTIPKSDVFDLADKMIDVLLQTVAENADALHVTDKQLINKYCEECKVKINDYRTVAIKNGYKNMETLVHGDYNPWNLLFHPEKATVIGVIDFDNSIVDNPVHDLVEALVDFCFFSYKNQTTRFKGLPQQFNQERGRLFIDSYRESAEIDLSQFAPYIEEVAAAITIELSALGLVRGDYNFRDCEKLSEISDILGRCIKQLIT